MVYQIMPRFMLVATLSLVELESVIVATAPYFEHTALLLILFAHIVYLLWFFYSFNHRF